MIGAREEKGGKFQELFYYSLHKKERNRLSAIGVGEAPRGSNSPILVGRGKPRPTYRVEKEYGGQRPRAFASWFLGGTPQKRQTHPPLFSYYGVSPERREVKGYQEKERRYGPRRGGALHVPSFPSVTKKRKGSCLFLLREKGLGRVPRS